jgi:hypothetical protein
LQADDLHLGAWHERDGMHGQERRASLQTTIAAVSPALLILGAIAIEGYVVLAVELVAIRQLTLYGGNATNIVAIVIAAVLLPLAFGYGALPEELDRSGEFSGLAPDGAKS